MHSKTFSTKPIRFTIDMGKWGVEPFEVGVEKLENSISM